MSDENNDARSIAAGDAKVEDKPSTAYATSKVLALAAIGWLGYMSYVVWDLHAQGFLNALLPAWNTAFAVGVALIVVQLYRDREWARRWMQSAALCTAIMNLLVAIKPGGEMYWIGVAVLGLTAWQLHAAREDYGSRDDGTPPGTLARALGMAALVGTIFVAVLPSTTWV